MQDANFVKILSRVNVLLPMTRLKKSYFNLFLLTRSFFHFNKNKNTACLSIHVSVCMCVSPSVYKILVSVRALAGILSHI